MGYDKVHWAAQPLDPAPGGVSAVRLTYHGKDGEEGFPGNVEVSKWFKAVAAGRRCLHRRLWLH